MPTLIRQKRAFQALGTNAKAKFLMTWVMELRTRFNAVKEASPHSSNVISFDKSLAELKTKCDIMQTKAKTNMSQTQCADFMKRSADLYDVLKGYDKALFGYERDILRPGSDGARKAKFVKDSESDASAVLNLLNDVKLQFEDAVNLYDSYGSNKDVLDAVNNGRKLASGLRMYYEAVRAFLDACDKESAKTFNKKQALEQLEALHEKNASLVERGEKYLTQVRLLARRLRGVTRKLAKQVGVLKPNWEPEINRSVGKGSYAKAIRDNAYMGGDEFPNPVTILLTEIRKLRVAPEIKELATLCIQQSSSKISSALLDAATLVKTIQSNATDSTPDGVTKDVKVSTKLIVDALSSTEVKSTKPSSQAKLGMQKAVVILSDIVTKKYLEQLRGYVSKYFPAQ